MYVRTTTLGTNLSMLNYIKSGESRYYDLALQASSGSKLAKPSDNPAAAKSVLNMNVQLTQLKSYLDNMSTAQSELDVSDDTLSSLSDSIEKANNYALQAANGTYSTSDLATLKSQIDQITENVVDLANTKYNGNYIFSGTSTTTPPYKIVKNAAGTITSIDYSGTPKTGDYQRRVTISDGTTATINTTGDQVFGSYNAGTGDNTGLLGNLVSLSNALATNDQTAISASITNFETNSDTALSTRTKFAAVTQRFELTTNSINTTITQLTSYKSDLEDADLAPVLTELSAQKTALQATMSITSQLLNGTSLLDYIR